MKKALSIIALIAVMCSLLALTVFATEEKAPEINTCIGCEICNPQEAEMDEMPPMEFKINFGAFVDSLAYMGKGLLGIFVVTLVIIGVVAILNWHGRSMENRKK